MHTNKVGAGIFYRTLVWKTVANIANIPHSTKCFGVFNINANKSMKVTKKEVIQIKPGKTKCFVCETDLAARNGQALVLNYVDKFFRPEGVSRYKTERDGNVLMVTAVAEN